MIGLIHGPEACHPENDLLLRERTMDNFKTLWSSSAVHHVDGWQPSSRDSGISWTSALASVVPDYAAFCNDISFARKQYIADPAGHLRYALKAGNPASETGCTLDIEQCHSIFFKAKWTDQDIRTHLLWCKLQGSDESVVADQILHLAVKRSFTLLADIPSLLAYERAGDNPGLITCLIRSAGPHVPPGATLFEQALFVREANTEQNALAVLNNGRLMTWGDSFVECVENLKAFSHLLPPPLHSSGSEPDCIDTGMILKTRALLSGRRPAILSREPSSAWLAEIPEARNSLEVLRGNHSVTEHSIEGKSVATIVGSTASIALVESVGVCAAAKSRAESRREAMKASHAIRSIAGILKDRPLSHNSASTPVDRDNQSEVGEFSGRIFIVSGAASGIGRSIALKLVACGAHVVLIDRDQTGLKAVVKSAEAVSPESVEYVTGELTDPQTVASAFQVAIEAFGGIDGVVSNAGVGSTGLLSNLTLESWRRCIDDNASSHFLMTRSALNVFAQQGMGGNIVYVASKVALSPGLGFGGYAIAKAAELQLARVAAIEGGCLGVRANVVNPGALFEGSNFWTPEIQTERALIHNLNASHLRSYYETRNLLRRPILPMDVANAVKYFLSEESSATTGCIITVDGGDDGAFPR